MDKKLIKKEIVELFEHAIKTKGYSRKDTDEFSISVETLDTNNDIATILFFSNNKTYVAIIEPNSIIDENTGEYIFVIKEVV